MASSLEKQLADTIENIKLDIVAKQNELKEAEQNLKDYNNNKTVVEKLLALSGNPVRKRRSKKGVSQGNG